MADGDGRPPSLELDSADGHVSNSYTEVEGSHNYQGPHDWRKRLRPVTSPIKSKSQDCLDALGLGDGKEEKPYKSRPLPPWKQDLIERNRKVARLVRRESSGRSKRNAVVRRESSGRSKKQLGSESPSGIGRKKSFRGGCTSDNAFTQQVVNENTGLRRRISPANSFKTTSGVRRTPSDKVLDPNDPVTKKRVERVRRARLYLLQQMGPNSFLIVGDSPEHKFKVIIGPQTCSCGKGPHCVHVLFVMLRVFQVSESDPCLWSKQLKNYEVETLFRAYNEKRTLKIEAQKLRRSFRPSPNTSRVPSPEETVAPSESDAGSVREEDDTCPICLLEMLEGESLLKCDGCQNKLHHHCITVWFEECKRQNESLICPLCRTRWKKSVVEVKGDEPIATEPPEAPPNTRVPSPQHDTDSTRLPYAEPIPGEYISMSTPWIEVLGEDLVSCLFSRNWSIRETGLKHLGKEMTREVAQVAVDSKMGMSLTNEETMMKLLKCCFSVVAFMCNDPVYRVFVGCLKVLRSVFSVVPSRDIQQRNKLQILFKPVVDSIVVKCTDGNRRTGELSISTMIELAKGQQGELALGKELANSGRYGLGGMAFLVQCLTEKYAVSEISWQWLLGRLYILERLVIDFQTEFLPRQRPDGASSESSLELIGATSKDEEEERPENYDRLLIVAEFSIKAVTNPHARISRVAKRVFLLAARYAAHLENLIEELTKLLNDLDFSHKKSLNKQLEKIIADFQLSEQIGRQLHVQNRVDPDVSPVDTPSMTPLSTPRCTSPVTVVSDVQSEADCNVGKDHPVVPPNTPIRDHRRHLQDEAYRASFDNVEKSQENVEEFKKQKFSKSLDDLNSSECRPRSRLAKFPIKKKIKSRSRSRSRTPQRIGPVLETNLDEVIKLEESRQRLNSYGKMKRDMKVSVASNDDDEDIDDLSLSLDPVINDNTGSTLAVSPPSRLLSNDLETDIDSVEPDLDSLLKQKWNSFDNIFDNQSKSAKNHSVDLTKHSLHVTPKLKTAKIPTSLDLEGGGCQKSKRSISPCAHVLELKRLSSMKNVSETPCQNSLSQSKNCTVINQDEKKQKCEDTEISRGQVEISSGRHASSSPSQTPGRPLSATYRSDDSIDYTASTPCSGKEKPVTFQTEVALGTPKHSPSHTLDKDDDDCHCKEEMEKEEALALAKAMEVSSNDPPTPIVPGLTPLDQEEVITIRIQPENCNEIDNNGNPPLLYYENVHWVKGSLLGTGAFSTCYQARDIKTGTIMALKQISFCRNSKTEQENVIEVITEEIHMMAKLSHPHIVRILGATRQGCHFNMFVEWMPGGSVAFLLGQYGKFSEEVITSYVLQVLRGLAYLHENHTLHRDLKGANLLIDSTGQRLRIGDFGAAARLASRSTGAGEFQGQLLGTIAFMAPEVLRGENYGRACDVWSVGCCLIEMATTKPPWNAHDISNHLALIFKIANAQSTPPIPEKLSPPLRDLLLRCLETVKEQRPSAKELLLHPLFTQYMQKRH
ncbi:mitogen-activated protein kinase kinase kinase 1-like [Mercenaria mercenaria]|uniref:mitogen-activated protein kinase kinase kinase 1-like n=1 Tax=Mercenaria mercenaria TaxID=6596 RepID=UPI00234EE7FD|nr:mitogen-activated protein kinase kinase kinase 1-like [Mercenaria mercenaria]